MVQNDSGDMNPAKIPIDPIKMPTLGTYRVVRKSSDLNQPDIFEYEDSRNSTVKTSITGDALIRV